MKRMPTMIIILVILAGLAACTTTSPQEKSPTDPATNRPSAESPSAASIDPTQKATPSPPEERETPRFEETSFCESGELNQLRNNADYDLTCGNLVVLEDRDHPDTSREITLPIVIFRSLSADRLPDPVIYLTGGGGADQMQVAHRYIESVGDAILEKRDFIMYNQRGSMHTEPELACPGFTDMQWRINNGSLNFDERNDQHAQFMLDCHDKLVSEGIVLSLYTSAQNAGDLNDLRIALGYEQVNIYGTSYGTRFGLDILRDYPEGIRSAVLDSVYPPHIDYYVRYAESVQRVFDAVFAQCAAQPECNEQYPDLEDRFYQIVDDLNANPVEKEYGQRTLSIDSFIFMDALSLYFYVPEKLPTVPLAIYAANEGDFKPMDWALQGHLQGDFLNWGVWWSMQCNEEVPFYTANDVVAYNASIAPQIAEAYGWPHAFDICAGWGSDQPDSIVNEPVISDVPTLVFAGLFDPITPPDWSEETASYLTNSFYYLFPNLGHGVMRADPCGLSIGLQFIDDPTSEPDSTCMERLGMNFD